VLTGAPFKFVDWGLMLAGDANDDNVVDHDDLRILNATYGKSIGDPGYDDRADFDGNRTVDINDRKLMMDNFGTSGAPPLSTDNR
jgi:hypothetical protein